MASGLRTGPAVAAELARSSAVVRVRNLQLTITGPRDGWGRSGKPQPLLCSVEVYMKRSFAASSSQDAVASDTVHYGLLSKAIPGFVEAVPSSRHSLQGMVYYVYSQLTGLCPGPNGMQQVSSGESFLDMSNVMGVKLTALLPKGSLMGAGVSEAAVALIKDGGTEQAGDPGPIYSTSLCIHRLQVPTLVGVNDNERTAKQIVVANISFEPLSSVEELDYVKLEAVVVETLSNSSRETLEALAEDISRSLAQYLRGATSDASADWMMTIALEKPTAIVLADAACVELRVRASEVRL